MKNLVILLSGRGSNMIAIARACAAQRWPARVVAVIASRPDAPGIAAAAGAGLPVSVLDSREFSDRALYDQRLADRIEACEPDLVVLAGYMRILTDAFVERFAGRLVNIHPSLLPSFQGLHTHRRALEAGVKVHGATVHFVTRDLDAGPVIAQAAVPVLDGDDEATLAQRVLDAEHRLYPSAVRWFVEGRLAIEGRRVRLLDPLPGESQLQWSGAQAER